MLSWNAKLFASGCLFVVDFSRSSWNLITNWFLRLWQSIIYAKSVFLAMRCDAIQSICTSETSCYLLPWRNVFFSCVGCLTRQRFGDLVQYRLFIWLILSILWNINIVGRSWRWRAADKEARASTKEAMAPSEWNISNLQNLEQQV